MRRLMCLTAACVLISLNCSTSQIAITALPRAAEFPVPVIEMTGSGSEIGSSHAQRLGGSIRNLFRAYLGRYFGNVFQKDLAMLAAGSFEKHLAPEHREEIFALAGGVGLDEREIMLGQCFLDLSPMTACSTVALPAAAAPDGIARFGRNLDFPSFNVADKESVVLIVRPQGRYAFASVAWPGMVGVLSGMNEHGLALANMEVARGPRLPVAMPYTLLYRMVLERCRTVDEAIALLEKTPRQTANNLMLMDAAGDRAVVEITPKAVVVRRAGDTAALISTNHQRGEDLDAAGRCSRFDSLHRASIAKFGNASREDVEKMLADVSMGNMTLQSMIFEPANRVIYLAAGANATSREYHRLDLKPRFEQLRTQ